MKCRECGLIALTRVKRKGLMQRFIYPRFRYYPWRCTMCGQVKLYRARSVEPVAIRQS